MKHAHALENEPPRDGAGLAAARRGIPEHIEGIHLDKKTYNRELERLQVELVKLQESVKRQGLKVVVVFEGRDAAGKGGVIRRITERVSPRVFRVVALPAPSEREKTQMYLQRYLAQFPAAGEVVIFDRSWYNRAGVESVMGFCSQRDVDYFLRMCPDFERAMVRSGIILIKYWFEVSQKEQEKRIRARIDDPLRTWKLSPMDLESFQRWYDYSRARDRMLQATDTEVAPWFIVPADSKKCARLNCIAHFLSMVPYEDLPRKTIHLPERQPAKGYVEPERESQIVPQRYV